MRRARGMTLTALLLTVTITGVLALLVGLHLQRTRIAANGEAIAELRTRTEPAAQPQNVVANDPEPEESFSGCESAAIGALTTLRTVQAEFQQAILVDENGKGIGEQNLFQELAGQELPGVKADNDTRDEK